MAASEERQQAVESADGEPTSQTTRALLSLRDLILSGEFPPGTRMSELPLVERLGVSRTPVRLALANLEHEGLLENLEGGGYAVREFTMDEIHDAIELRGVLEGTAARFAAERGAARAGSPSGPSGGRGSTGGAPPATGRSPWTTATSWIRSRVRR